VTLDQLEKAVTFLTRKRYGDDNHVSHRVLRDELLRAFQYAGVEIVNEPENKTPAEKVTIQWGVRWPWSKEIELNSSEGSARWRAAGNAYGINGIVVFRTVGEWTEAAPQ